MKTIKFSFNKLSLVLLFVIVYNDLLSQTNVYKPFPDSNIIWVGTAWFYSQGTNYCDVYDDYNLYISGDTTLGNNTYHKLFKNRHYYANCPPPGFYYYGESGGF